MDFSHVESEYRRLKAQFDAGNLTEADFKAKLQDLMLEDEQGRWWVIGYETGQWYLHDGEKWVPAEPPRPAPPPPAEPPVRLPDRAEAPAARVAVPQAWAKAGPVASEATAFAPPAILRWWPLALIIVAWGANVMLTGAQLEESWNRNLFLWLGWPLAGLVTGVAVRLIEPAVQWKHVLVAAAVWGLSGWAFLWGVTESGNVLAYPGIAGATLGGGLTIGLILKQILAPVRWYHVLIVAAAWAIAILGSYFIAYYLRSQLDAPPFSTFALSGALGGALGGGVTLWQTHRARRAAVQQT